MASTYPLWRVGESTRCASARRVDWRLPHCGRRLRQSGADAPGASQLQQAKQARDDDLRPIQQCRRNADSFVTCKEHRAAQRWAAHRKSLKVNDLRCYDRSGCSLALQKGMTSPDLRADTLDLTTLRKMTAPMQRSRTHGFTLIELLIVVVIIGILAAVAIPKFSSTKQRASRAAGLADIRNLSTSQEGFFVDSARYAALTDTGSAAGKMNFAPSNGNTALLIAATATGWNAVVDIPGGQRCGIYHGSAPPPPTMPGTIQSGLPVCW